MYILCSSGSLITQHGILVGEKLLTYNLKGKLTKSVMNSKYQGLVDTGR